MEEFSEPARALAASKPTSEVGAKGGMFLTFFSLEGSDLLPEGLNVIAHLEVEARGDGDPHRPLGHVGVAVG